MHHLKLLIINFVCLAGIFACSSNNYNPSVYDFTYQQQVTEQSNIKTIMIAPFNFYTPSRHYLQQHEEKIDRQIRSYLEKSGYHTISNKSFKSVWRKITDKYGDMYDPTTGKMTAAFEPALEEALNKLFTQQPTLDAVLFTDLIEEPLIYSKGSKKSAQWSGVRRKIKLEGMGNGLPDDFDWSEMIDGISIVTNLINRDTKVILHNKGGIQVAQALVVHNNTGRFKRRNDLLTNDKEIIEGVKLALHPFILMKDYPKKEKS